MMASFGFPKSVRLLNSSEFDRVFQRRCSAADGLIVVYSAPGRSAAPRLGMVVSRKCGNAVMRNHWKRALREAFRLIQHQLPRQLDLVVLPCRGAKPDVRRLQDSLQKLASRSAGKLPESDTMQRENS